MEANELRKELLIRVVEESRKLFRENLDLEAQVENLSDILAEKDHRIMDLEAQITDLIDMLPMLTSVCDQREKHT